MSDDNFDENVDSLRNALREMRGDGAETTVSGLRLIRAFLKLNKANRDRIVDLTERLGD